MRRSVGRRAGRPFLVLLVGVLVCVVAGATVAGSDLVVGEISVRRVAVGDDLTGGLSRVDATVGDLLHIRAAVTNGTAEKIEQLQVDFFFTEVVTREHGLLGTQSVFSLDPGQTRFPAISVRTDGFTPGFYVFTAAIRDPEAAQDGSTSIRYVSSNTQLETDTEWTVIADSGASISEIQLGTTVFEACQFGGIQNSFSLSVRNVGTVDLQDVDLSVTVAPKFGDKEQSPLSIGNIDASLVPGSFEGLVTITGLDTSSLQGFYAPPDKAKSHFEVLGRPLREEESLKLVIRMTPAPESGSPGTTQEVELPLGGEGARLYSQIDLWQYPAPSGCGCESRGTCAENLPVANPAVRPVYSADAAILFHLTASGDGTYELHALDPESGEDLGDPLVLSDRVVTDPVIDVVTERDFLGAVKSATVSIYVGTEAGSVDLHTLVFGKSDGVFEWKAVGDEGGPASWEGLSGIVSATTASSPATHLLHVEASLAEGEDPQDLLIVSGPDGIYVLDAEDGTLVQTAADWWSGTTSTPSRVAVTTGSAPGYLWYAVADRLYGVELANAPTAAAPDRLSCSVDLNWSVTTSVVETGDFLFWGNATGEVEAIPVAAACAGNSASVESARVLSGGVAGLTVGTDGTGLSDSDQDPVVFATSVNGVVASIEFDANAGEFERSISSSQLLNLAGSDDLDSDAVSSVRSNATRLVPINGGTSAPPVILPETGPETVFLASQFAASSGDPDKQGFRWAVVGLQVNNPGEAFTVRKATVWGEQGTGEEVQFVFKLDEGVGPIVEPLVVNDILVVVVPGDRLYAFNVEELQN